MVRSVVGKVVWVGRATVFLVGLAVILALVFGAATAALAALAQPGDPFKLGKSNQINSVSSLVGNTTRAMLRVVNNGTGPALDLQVKPGKSPSAFRISPPRGTTS